MFNPYPYQYQQYRPPMQTEIIKVRGRESAQAVNLAPNCSALLLDETAPIVWLCMADGVGRVTATPYDIKVHEQIDASADIESRIASLEKTIAEMEAKLNDKSNVSNVESKSSLAND